MQQAYTMQVDMYDSTKDAGRGLLYTTFMTDTNVDIRLGRGNSRFIGKFWFNCGPHGEEVAQQQMDCLRYVPYFSHSDKFSPHAQVRSYRMQGNS